MAVHKHDIRRVAEKGGGWQARSIELRSTQPSALAEPSRDEMLACQAHPGVRRGHEILNRYLGSPDQARCDAR